MNLDIGDVAVLDMRFTVTTTNALTDPTAITVVVRAPDGTTPAAATPAKVVTGVWRTTINCTMAGPWRYQITSTGAATGVAYGSFYVQPAAF